MSTQAEAVNIPGQPFRLLVQFKNTATLYGRIIRLNSINNFPSRKEEKKFWKEVTQLQPYTQFIQALPATVDYQLHSTELKIDALPAGRYALLGSTGKAFSDSTDHLLLQYFDVSNISYIHNGADYFVLHRATGKPLEKIKVQVDGSVYNSKTGKWVNKNFGTRITNANGLFKLPELKQEDHTQISLRFFSKADTLDLDENEDYRRSYGYYNRDNDDDDADDTNAEYEEDNAKGYFFTDRAIYRPGQTVFFKGIAVTKDHRTRKAKLYLLKDSVKVYLYDANSKKIDSLILHQNDYGSFSGRFRLPENVLTGQFRIDANDPAEGNANFSVEEYKRPKFYVAFDTIQSGYRLNDTIRLRGYAKAYAGNTIGSAQVKYTISRNARFPYTWAFRGKQRPYSSSMQITDSILATDDNGYFEIAFKALPDEAVDKTTSPVFDFSVEATVTDVNGESREQKTTVSVAYQSLLLQMKLPAVADAASFRNIYITTQNMSGKNIPANVQVRLYPLQTPNRLVRKRYWQQPDLQLLSREQYLSNFPYDDYADETNQQNWPVRDAILQDTLNTAEHSAYSIKPSVLEAGWYKVEASTTDAYGQEVRESKYIQVYSSNTHRLAMPQFNWQNIVSNSGQPGDTAKLLIGTAANDAFIIQGRQHVITGKKALPDTYDFYTLNKTVQTIAIPITEADRSGTAVYYGFVQQNRFYTGGMSVYVTAEDKSLQMSYETYRNKTEPGSKEQWTLQVNGSKGERAAAELLTGMYDASLDQFTKQQWQVPGIQPYPVTLNNYWQGGHGFDQNTSSANPFPTYEKQYSKQYDFLALDAGVLSESFTLRHLYHQSNISTDKLLAGKAAGVYISGSPGASSEIRLRGSASLNDVVVTGYGSAKKQYLTGLITVYKTQYPTITDALPKLKVLLGTDNLSNVLVVIDGVGSDKKITDLTMDEIDFISTLKGGEATALYGSKAMNGVIVVTTKEYSARHKKKEDEAPVQVRTNFNETAFFFPQLYADTAGNYRFSFTMPEALTQWKWMSLAHTKDLLFGYSERSITTQKTLMVQPNHPRFLREGDQVELTAKITNLSDSEFTGQASLQIVDAVTQTPVDGLFQNVFPDQYFTAGAGKSALVQFPVHIPSSYSNPVTLRVIAKTNNHSDGEEITLPVLSNRMLVTESLPLLVKGDTTVHFSFKKLIESGNNPSGTLRHSSLTVEYTSNPVWYAVQALPYLIEFPHECAEQTFNRLYANALAASITGHNPRIQQVLELWKKDSTAVLSNLSKNEDLKQVLLQETPWVLDAASEAQQHKNLALLLNVLQTAKGLRSAIEKLQQMQLENGAFPWFKGGREDRYITQYILTGIGKLTRLQAIPKDLQARLAEINGKALTYLDNEIAADYQKRIQLKTDLSKNLLSSLEIQYWYMRSFFIQQNKNSFPKKVFDWYTRQTEQYGLQESPLLQGMIALTSNRFAATDQTLQKTTKLATAITKSLKENAVEDASAGMYWKNNTSGYYWYQSPIETESLLIEVFNELTQDKRAIGNMQTWLLQQKQTNNWKTTKATADACYALLLNNALNKETHVQIQLGNLSFNSDGVSGKQAGSGYFSKKIEGDKIEPSMGTITITTSSTATGMQTMRAPLAKSSEPSWGAVYWQYLEDLDKISSAATPLSLTKELFVEQHSPQGNQLVPVQDNDELKIGDKVIIRIVLKSSRDMEYLHLKDMRAAAMEPVNVLSGYKYQDGLGYYEATKDASTNFFISNLTKGTYVFEYPVYLTHAGNFSVGLASIQCMYAPEFSSHSEGIKINIVSKLP